MATSTLVRDWAREQGETLSAKGRVPRGVVDRWNAANPDDLYDPDKRTDAGPDYPDPDFESAFAADPGPLPDTGETAPRKPPAKRTRGAWWQRTTKGGKKRPRVSTEDFLGAVWRGLAGMARPLPPLHRTLRLQAPVAGMILDDAVQGTVIDPLLQPLARAASAGKAIQALAGPPVLVTAITMHAAQQAARGAEPNPVFMSVATEALRSSLMAWLDVAGPKFEIAMKREREFESRYGSSVDEMMAWVFSAPMDPAEEDAWIRRAQGIRDDDHPGM